jgi:hypothetical protein
MQNINSESKDFFLNDKISGMQLKGIDITARLTIKKHNSKTIGMTDDAVKHIHVINKSRIYFQNQLVNILIQ